VDKVSSTATVGRLFARRKTGTAVVSFAENPASPCPGEPPEGTAAKSGGLRRCQDPREPGIKQQDHPASVRMSQRVCLAQTSYTRQRTLAPGYRRNKSGGSLCMLEAARCARCSSFSLLFSPTPFRLG